MWRRSRLVLLSLSLIIIIILSIYQLLRPSLTTTTDPKFIMTKTAVCLGASGAVGQKLVEELVENPNFSTILTMVRSASKGKISSGKIVEHVVQNMSEIESEVQQAISKRGKEEEVVGFSTLGVGSETAFMTIDQHRAVDVELNAKFARGLKKSGKVSHLVFMSVVGANPENWAYGPGGAGFPRYSRVKGEAEEAVKSVGLDHVSIFQPATILGIPHTPKMIAYVSPFFDYLVPVKFASVKVSELARSMAIRGSQVPSESIRYFTHPQMMELIAQTSS